jgi:hypothetical protein
MASEKRMQCELRTKHSSSPGVGLNVVACAIIYAVALSSCIWIWHADPTWLYIGRDSEFSLWLAHAYFDWASPFGVTTLNPYQGMGSMLIPMNPYFNPGAWIFQTELDLPVKFVISMIVYFLEVTASSFLLGRALGFSAAFSCASTLWLVFLFFPPFNFVFGLNGVLATSPQWATTLSLCNLILVLFILVGRGWPRGGFVYASAVNSALVGGIFVLSLMCLLVAPFYSAGTMLGLALLCAIILFSSAGLTQALWRIGAGLFSLAMFQALGIFDFFAASKSFTARFSTVFTTGGSNEMMLPRIHWPIELSWATWSSVPEWFCAAAVMCGRLSFPGSLTNSYWLQVAIIAGAVAVWLRMPKPLSQIGGWFALLWTSLLLFWLACALGIVTEVIIQPIYFVVSMISFWAFFSIFGVWQVVAFVAGLIISSAPQIQSMMMYRARALRVVLPAAVGACSLAMAWGYVAFLTVRAPVTTFYPNRGAFDVRKSDSIVDRLRREIAIRPGDSFRGSVATIWGAKGGSLRKALNLPDTTPLAPGQFEHFMRKVGTATGNDHDLFDLWWFNIPTVSEYAQGVSRQLMFYVTNFLSDPGDPAELSIAFPRRANIDVLAAMGARFIIIDRTLPVSRATLLSEESIAGAELYLYEIAQPNLGTYSPVAVEVDPGTDTLRTSVNTNPAILATTAFVQRPIVGSFTPARKAQMIFEKGSVRVVASSEGESMLLLPLQYSHCLRVSDPAVRVWRADLMFTLIQFVGAIDAQLDWKFNFWRNSDCRMQDVDDMKKLGLLSAG